MPVPAPGLRSTDGNGAGIRGYVGSERAAAVFRAADGCQNAAARFGRCPGDLGRFAVLFSGAAACRLCLRASVGSDARPRWALVVHAGLLLAAFAALPIRLPPDLDRRKATPTCGCLPCSDGVGLAVLHLVGQRTVAATLVWPDRASAQCRPLLSLQREQRRQPGRAAGVSDPDRTAARLPCRARLALELSGPRLAIIGCGLALLSQERQALPGRVTKAPEGGRPPSWERAGGLGILVVRALRAARCLHHLPNDRPRVRAAALGPAARTLPGDLHCRIPQAQC